MEYLNFISALMDFLEIPIEENILYDPENTPFAYISFITFDHDNIRDISYGTFLNIKRKKEPVSRPIPANYDHDACLAIAKELQAKYLDDCARQDDDPNATISHDGFCDAIWINNDTRVVISIVANPQNSQFCFTRIKNKIEIHCNQQT